MPNALNMFSLLFADDTSYLAADSDLEQLIIKANIELNKACVWFKSNKLTLNASKTKFMIFSPQGTTVFTFNQIKIEGEEIERIGDKFLTKKFKLVGVNLDDKLSWVHHATHVRNKLASANYALAKVRRLVPFNVKMIIYNALFKCHLDNALITWGGCTKSNTRAIVNLQKKAVRHVVSRGYNAHTDPIFKKHNLYKFEDLYKNSLSIFMFNLSRGLQPSSIGSIFTSMGKDNRSNNYILQKCKFAYMKNQVPYTLINNWLQVHPADKNLMYSVETGSKILKSTSVPSTKKACLENFKKSLLQQVMATYSSAVTCKNKRCSDCRNK